VDFSFDQRTTDLRDQLLAFMEQHVYPAESALADKPSAGGWSRPPIVRELQREAKAQGLWNLFLPGEYGAGLTNLQYARQDRPGRPPPPAAEPDPGPAGHAGPGDQAGNDRVRLRRRRSRGHAELAFRDVRVPASNLIAGEGEGFAIAQARLGPGRIHHCMRLVGLAERALELMCRRALSRVAFGSPLADQGVVRDWIAESRVRIEQLRLLILKTAWLMDTVGNQGAHTEVQAIKVATPATVEWILDKAIQAHGAAGVSQDFPLARWYASARTLRLADGPDEAHKNSLAKRELAKYRAR